MARQDHLVVAIVAGKNHVFGAVGDVAVGLLPPPLLQGSFSLAVRSLSRGAVCDGFPSARPLLPKRRQVSSGVFPCWRWSDGAVRFRNPYDKRGGDLGSFFLAGQILSSICSKLYSCVSFCSISVVRLLHPCLVHSMYARPSFFC